MKVSIPTKFFTAVGYRYWKLKKFYLNDRAKGNMKLKCLPFETLICQK